MHQFARRSDRLNYQINVNAFRCQTVISLSSNEEVNRDRIVWQVVGQTFHVRVRSTCLASNESLSLSKSIFPRGGNCLASISRAIRARRAGYFPVSDTSERYISRFTAHARPLARSYNPVYYIKSSECTRCNPLYAEVNENAYDYSITERVQKRRSVERLIERARSEQEQTSGARGGGGFRLHEIIEDNFLGLWPRLVLPCPLNFHVRGCGHLAVYMLAYSPCICKAPSVVSRDGQTRGEGARGGSRYERISMTCDVFPEVQVAKSFQPRFDDELRTLQRAYAIIHLTLIREFTATETVR